MIVREATAEDLSGIFEILLSVSKLGSFKVPEKPVIEKNLSATMKSEDHTVLVAVADGETAGYISIHWVPYLYKNGSEGYVSELFVLEKFRGRKVGSSLLDRAVELAKSRKCSRMQLINFKDRESYRRKFYAKHGWQEREMAADFLLDLEK